MSNVPVPARRGKRRAPAAPPVPPSDRDLARQLAEARDFIDTAREALEELLFTAEDATRLRPILSRKSLRRAALEDGIEAQRALRFVQRGLDAVRAELALRGAR